MTFLRNFSLLLSKRGTTRRRHGRLKTVGPISNNWRFEALEDRRMLAGEGLPSANDGDETPRFTAPEEVSSEVGNGAINDGDSRAAIQALRGGTQSKGKKATFNINDAEISEPVTGTVKLKFTVFRSGDDSITSYVDYHTMDDSASAPGDYVEILATPILQKLTFLPDETSKDVFVTVNADAFDNEGTEKFFLNLTNAENAGIKRDQGIGFIRDTDPLSTSMYVNSISVMPDPRGPRFAIEILDETGDPISGVGVVVKLSDPDIPEGEHDNIIRQWIGETNESGIMTTSSIKGGRFGLDPDKTYNVEVIDLNRDLFAWEQELAPTDLDLDGDGFPEIDFDTPP